LPLLTKYDNYEEWKQADETDDTAEIDAVFEDLDKQPFNNMIMIDEFHNRKYLSQKFKQYFDKNIAHANITDKIFFKYCYRVNNDITYKAVPLLKIFD
jgi:hypothetical protein